MTVFRHCWTALAAATWTAATLYAASLWLPSEHAHGVSIQRKAS